MKKLIFGNVFVNSKEKVELTEMWLQMNRHINPDCDLLLVETPADKPLSTFVPSLQDMEATIVTFDGAVPAAQAGINWVCFPDNIGHLSYNGKDGWSRAFSYGVRWGLENGYDYIAHIEGDILCRLKYDNIIAKMTAHNLGAISTIATKWNFMEVGLIYMQAAYLREINFLGKFDWQHDTRDVAYARPEHKVREALNGRLLFDLWYGGRDENTPEDGLFSEDDIPHLSFFTHAKDHRYYYYFMDAHAAAVDWHPLYKTTALTD